MKPAYPTRGKTPLAYNAGYAVEGLRLSNISRALKVGKPKDPRYSRKAESQLTNHQNYRTALAEGEA